MFRQISLLKMKWMHLRGTVVEGHRVASGLNGDPRFPEGTLAMQMRFFLEGGMDLSGYHRATINLDLSPWRFVVRNPVKTFPDLKWCPTEPAEDFSFFDCLVAPAGNSQALKFREGLIYYPHPETKPEHFQSPHVLEILSEFIQDLEYGGILELALLPNQIFPYKD